MNTDFKTYKKMTKASIVLSSWLIFDGKSMRITDKGVQEYIYDYDSFEGIGFQFLDKKSGNYISAFVPKLSGITKGEFSNLSTITK